jgi:hypothetical protein
MNKLGLIFMYLDPGTGSMIVQLVIATVTAAIFFLRGVRERITSFSCRFRKKSSKL